MNRPFTLPFPPFRPARWVQSPPTSRLLIARPRFVATGPRTAILDPIHRRYTAGRHVSTRRSPRPGGLWTRTLRRGYNSGPHRALTVSKSASTPGLIWALFSATFGAVVFLSYGQRQIRLENAQLRQMLNETHFSWDVSEDPERDLEDALVRIAKAKKTIEAAIRASPANRGAAKEDITDESLRAMAHQSLDMYEDAILGDDIEGAAENAYIFLKLFGSQHLWARASVGIELPTLWDPAVRPALVAAARQDPALELVLQDVSFSTPDIASLVREIGLLKHIASENNNRLCMLTMGMAEQVLLDHASPPKDSPGSEGDHEPFIEHMMRLIALFLCDPTFNMQFLGMREEIAATRGGTDDDVSIDEVLAAFKSTTSVDPGMKAKIDVFSALCQKVEDLQRRRDGIDMS